MQSVDGIGWKTVPEEFDVLYSKGILGLGVIFIDRSGHVETVVVLHRTNS